MREKEEGGEGRGGEGLDEQRVGVGEGGADWGPLYFHTLF